MIYIKRKEHFCAAHKLWNDKWDAATNKRIFGKCSNENYHGHEQCFNYSPAGAPG